MTLWIDVAVYAALLIICWFVFPNLDWRVAMPHLTQRNPEWLASDEAAARFEGSRWGSRTCYALGILSIAALVAYQLDAWPESLRLPVLEGPKWLALFTITIGSVVLLFVLVVIAALGLRARVRAEVPLPAQRRASLATRSLDDFMPRRLRIVTYALIGAHLLAWIVVGAFDLYAAGIDDFWGRMLPPFFLHAVGLFYARWSIQRPPGAADRMLGVGNRASEVWFCFAVQIFALLQGAASLYAAVVATADFDPQRAMTVSTVLFVVGSGAALYAFGAVKTRAGAAHQRR
jgi:hypothetical protein